MKTIHTLGCSFTNWLYPTWSDYIAEHTDLKVINLASTGQGNDSIKYNLYNIDFSDHVFIMFSGYDRFNIGIDADWMQENTILQKDKIKKINDIINQDNNYLYFLDRNPLLGFLSGKYVEGKKYSNFHYYTKMLEYIYDCQNYLQLKKINYTFCLWQGLPNNLQEIKAINQHKNNIKNFTKNKLYKKLFDSIDWKKFVQPITKGLWEHVITDKKLVEAQSLIDMHPNTLCHFSYFKKYIKPIINTITDCKNNLDQLENKAYKFSKNYIKFCKKIKIMPEYDKNLKKSLFKKFHNENEND